VSRWFDPSSGAFAAVPGSPLTNSGVRNFTPPGNNTDGDGGWVLVLETNPPPDSPPPPIQPRFIQQNYATPQSPQNLVSVAYPNAQAAGSANILAIGWNDTAASLTNVSDSAGNRYQAAVPTFRGNGLSQAIYFALNIKTGANTVTAQFDQAAAYVDFRAAEYSGLAATNAFDAGISGTGNGTTATSGPLAISATNELLFGAGMTATTFTGPGPGFTRRVITSPDADIVEDQVASMLGPFSATAVLDSGAWLMQLAAFKLPPALLALRIFITATNTAVVAWPGVGTGFTLQENSGFGTTNWVSATNAVGVMNGENQVLLSPHASQRFYRLKYP